MDRLFDLTGKAAIVTGGNGGLGLAMALGLAGAGADIAVAARNDEKTAEALPQIEALGVKAVGITAGRDPRVRHTNDGRGNPRCFRPGGYTGKQCGHSSPESPRRHQRRGVGLGIGRQPPWRISGR